MLPETVNRMKRILTLITFALMILGCARTPKLERMAYARLPKALETTMMEELSIPGGADILSPETMYSCDSLCIIQFKAVVKDPKYEGYSFPVRYALLRDMVFSRAYGRPVYSEKMTGCPDMDRKEIKKAKADFKKNAQANYTYYAAVSNLVASEDL